MRPDKDVLTYLLAACIGLTALVTGQRDNTTAKDREQATPERAPSYLAARPRQADRLLVNSLTATNDSAPVYPL